ncbi:hypothetical protein GJAV_G00255060 [Gymnothorax javanicus]|nr:hypothetical protein GJAV_G00255060 [Gymnothorax javanicus]
MPTCSRSWERARHIDEGNYRKLRACAGDTANMKTPLGSNMMQVNGVTSGGASANLTSSNSDETKSCTSLEQQYEERVRPCIDLIDSLRSLGVEEDLALPAIAVIGDQSSGKSSILEALSGVALPRGSGIVTRCPLILKLKRVKKGQPWAGRLAYKFNNKIHKDILKSPEEVGKAVLAVQEVIAGKGEGISHEMITLEIKSSGVPDLTLIDLPGIARVAVGNQSQDIGDQIKRMIRSYISKQETISLVVVPANIDIATTEALKMAQEVDPSGHRTLGVLTKPDLVDKGAEKNVVNTVNNLTVPLKKGYMIVKCRGQQDLNDNLTLEKAILNERIFFQDHPYFKSLMDKQKATIPFLAERLTKELVEHIGKSLPKLVDQIDKKLEQTKQNLRTLGDGVPKDQGQMTQFLIAKINKFNNVLTEVVRAEEVVEEGNTKLFTKIRCQFTKWKALLDKKATKLDEHLRDEVEEFARTRRGKELPGFVNYRTFEGIVKQYIQEMEEPAIVVLNNVAEIIRCGVNNIAASHFEAYPNLLRVAKVHLEDLGEQENSNAEEKLHSQFSMEKTVYAQDCLYSNQLDAIKRKTILFGAPTNADISEMAHHVNTYFKLASDRLANQIPLIIQYHMLELYISRLHVAMVGIMGEDHGIGWLLREDSNKSRDREALMESQTAACLSQRCGGMSPQSQRYNDSSLEKEIRRFFIQPLRFTITQDAWLQYEEPIKRHTVRFGKRNAALPVEQNLKRKGTTEAEYTVRSRGGDEAAGEICIKTLEEIRQKKAAKSEGQGRAHEAGHAGGRYSPAAEEKEAGQRRGGEAEGEERGASSVGGPSQEGRPFSPARSGVKTLEEILREKAARTQVKAQGGEGRRGATSSLYSSEEEDTAINRNTATGERSRHSTVPPHTSSSAPLDELDELMIEFTGHPLDREMEMELDPLMDLEDYIVELMATIDNS